MRKKMATDLSNIDSFFNDTHQPQTPALQTKYYAGDTIEQILKESSNNNIAQEPIDIRAVVEKIFKIKIVETDLGKSVSGFLEKVGSEWLIYVNILESETRKRFTIAHELGHFIYDRNKYIADASLEPDQIFFRDDNTNPIERRANEFAAELLMPKNTFDDCVKNGCNTIAGLADKFKVSTSAIKYRAYKLGYLSEYK
jgi:Zn-dependent peptidase ImmA (M78 family)